MAQQPPMQAQDTFVATLQDGTDRLVTKGEVLPFGHELVRRDREGSGTLFRALDMGVTEEPPAKSEPEPDAPKTPVKPPAARTAGKPASRG